MRAFRLQGHGNLVLRKRFVAVPRGRAFKTGNATQTTGSPVMAQQATLYSFPIAFNPAKTLLAIEEKGLKNVRIQNVNLFNGASLQPWYMKISPGSTAPALVVGGRTLTQTREILQWVDEQGEPLGGTQVDRALVTQLVDDLHAWDGNLFAFANVPAGAKGVLASLGVYKDRVAEAQKRKAEAAGDKVLAEAYRKKLEATAASRAEVEDSAKVEANKQQLGSLLDRAEELLAKNKYLAGSAFSMADVVLACILFRLGTVNQTKQWLQPRPKVSSYYNEIKQRPACKKVFGPPSSPLTAVSYILPAAIKAKVARLTGWYA